MKLISVKDDLFKICNDTQLLYNKGRRPYVLVVKLTYRDTKINFAIPFRSNIPPDANKSYYFSLPPRKITKSKHRHGLHYIKAFPITSEYYAKYNIDDNIYYEKVRTIINDNLVDIIQGMQKYLDLYENGLREKYCVDIDNVIKKLDIKLTNASQYSDTPVSVAANTEPNSEYKTKKTEV